MIASWCFTCKTFPEHVRGSGVALRKAAPDGEKPTCREEPAQGLAPLRSTNGATFDPLTALVQIKLQMTSVGCLPERRLCYLLLTVVTRSLGEKQCQLTRKYFPNCFYSPIQAVTTWLLAHASPCSSGNQELGFDPTEAS